MGKRNFFELFSTIKSDNFRAIMVLVSSHVSFRSFVEPRKSRLWSQSDTVEDFTSYQRDFPHQSPTGAAKCSSSKSIWMRRSAVWKTRWSRMFGISLLMKLPSKLIPTSPTFDSPESFARKHSQQLKLSKLRFNIYSDNFINERPKVLWTCKSADQANQVYLSSGRELTISEWLISKYLPSNYFHIIAIILLRTKWEKCWESSDDWSHRKTEENVTWSSREQRVTTVYPLEDFVNHPKYSVGK